MEQVSPPVFIAIGSTIIGLLSGTMYLLMNINDNLIEIRETLKNRLEVK